MLLNKIKSKGHIPLKMSSDMDTEDDIPLAFRMSSKKKRKIANPINDTSTLTTAPTPTNASTSQLRATPFTHNKTTISKKMQEVTHPHFTHTYSLTTNETTTRLQIADAWAKINQTPQEEIIKTSKGFLLKTNHPSNHNKTTVTTRGQQNHYKLFHIR